MSTKRIFYASEAVGMAKYSANINTAASWKAVRGLQVAGLNTSFNLEQVFEIGQLAIYENIENLPEVELTMEKVMDGYAPLLSLATQGGTASSLIGRSNQRCHASIAIYTDTTSLASGTPVHQCVLSGLYLSQFSFDFPVEGNFKESVTLVGNNKTWKTGSFTFNGFTPTHGVTSLSPAFTDGVARRQEFDMATSRFPTNIPGISSSGTNNALSADEYSASIQNIKVSANLGRDNLLELGRFVPYFRYVNFPVEISTSIEIISKGGDLVTAVETGDNLTDESIYLVTKDNGNPSLLINLGSLNKLQSVNYSGGNAGGKGNNRTTTFNYITFNDFDLTHDADPDWPLLI